MDSDTMKKRLRYQGGQYANGQVARGGGQREPHMLEQAADYMERLEDMLFERGAMEEAPCFCCGYNGPGYFQPDKHKCAERHHRLTANVI
jgi:hypothetical protein